MRNQVSAITAREGSIRHDIETDGSHHHGVQIEMTTTVAAAAAGGGGRGGATQVEGNAESAAGPQSVQRKRDSGIFPSIETDGSRHHGVQNEMTTMVAGTITNPINEQQPVQENRGSGIFTSICSSTLAVGATAIFQPTPNGLDSVAFLIAAYWLDIIMLLSLGILLLGLTFALPHVPDNWVPAVRAAAATVTVALLVLLFFFVAFVTCGLVRQGLLP